jgi:hypothetical protein
VTLSERLSHLEALADERTAGDLAVIRRQLAAAEGKMLSGQADDLPWRLRIIEQRIERAEHRLRAA